MKEQQDTIVSLLRQIVQRRGQDYLREGGGKFFVNAFAEMGGEKQDVRLLRYLTECGAHEDLLDAASLTPAMQRTYYSQAVQKLCDKTLIPEALAHRVCGDFWQAVYNTQPPISAPVPTKPQPAKTAEELFQEAQNCQDKARAADLLRQAAEQSHLEAMLHLGFVYEYGNGIPKDPGEAFRWFRKAAEQGLAPAQDRVAYCYDKGFGVERDLDQAIAWCKKANNQNFPDAARHLRQLEEKKRQEAPDTPGNKPEFDIVNGALLKYNGTATKVTVPGGVTRIGAKAFFGNDSIRTVTLPYGLIGISAEAFAGCRNLQEITISGSVIAINLDVFAGCRKLKKITLESGVQKLIFGDHLDQLGSVSIVIPDSVSSVTWSHMPENQRAERMKHPKSILASKSWTDRLQDFFIKNPDFRPGKSRRLRFLDIFMLTAVIMTLFIVVSSLFGGDSGKRTRSDLAPYNLEDSIEDMLLAGTEEIYTYPDGTWMEFYYDDAGKEIYRIYVNLENEIENLFEARYDSIGRLVYHQIFDGAGNLLRADSYDFHSNEDTAQRRVTFGDGSGFQGISTFDKNGYETFTVIHEDGTQTVSKFEDGGILAHRTLLDADGNAPDVIYGDDPVYVWINWENVSRVYGPWKTVIGWKSKNADAHTSVNCSYVQGLCGGALKEYTVSGGDAVFVETYDPKGNLLENAYYVDAQMSELGSHEVYCYDSNGIYTGYTETFYFSDGDYWISTYDENGIKLTMENHYINAEGVDVVSYERYETEVDDQGREILVRTFDAESGRLISVDETEYDKDGNEAKTIRTYYHNSGDYNITVRDGEGNITSDITYYPSGSVQTENAYNSEGQHIKTTRYYENGQVQTITEYSGTGETLSRKRYYENGKPQSLDEYDAQGNLTKSTSYYENGKVDNLTEYNSQGDIRKMTSYYESGQLRHLTEYNDQGETIKQVYYNEDGTVLK